MSAVVSTAEHRYWSPARRLSYHWRSDGAGDAHMRQEPTDPWEHQPLGAHL